jgi:hypothetical protein
VPVLLYDASSKGSINFLNLAEEFLNKNAKREKAAAESAALDKKTIK